MYSPATRERRRGREDSRPLAQSPPPTLPVDRASSHRTSRLDGVFALLDEGLLLLLLGLALVLEPEAEEGAAHHGADGHEGGPHGEVEGDIGGDEVLEPEVAVGHVVLPEGEGDGGAQEDAAEDGVDESQRSLLDHVGEEVTGDATSADGDEHVVLGLGGDVVADEGIDDHHAAAADAHRHGAEHELLDEHNRDPEREAEGEGDAPLGLELGDTELLGEEETAEGTDGHTDGADEELVELGALGDEEDGSRRDDERHDLLEAEGLLVGVGAVAGHVHGAVSESLEETMGIISMVSARS